jgi:hypothetical protein
MQILFLAGNIQTLAAIGVFGWELALAIKCAVLPFAPNGFQQVNNKIYGFETWLVTK